MTHNHSHCVGDAMTKAERLCASSGARFTALRRRVLELVWSSHQSVKAYDLLDDLRLSDPSAKPATVYRALDFLLEQGLIHRVESLNAFVGCRHPDKVHQSLLLICTNCHVVEERSADGVMKALEAELDALCFSPRRRLLEIYGLCSECSNGF